MFNMAGSQKRREIWAGIIQSMLGWLHKIAIPNEFDRCDKSEIDRMPAGASVFLNHRLATFLFDSEHVWRIQFSELRDLLASTPAPDTIEGSIINLNTVGSAARPPKYDSSNRSRLH